MSTLLLYFYHHHPSWSSLNISGRHYSGVINISSPFLMCCQPQKDVSFKQYHGMVGIEKVITWVRQGEYILEKGIQFLFDGLTDRSKNPTVQGQGEVQSTCPRRHAQEGGPIHLFTASCPRRSPASFQSRTRTGYFQLLKNDYDSHCLPGTWQLACAAEHLQN